MIKKFLIIFIFCLNLSSESISLCGKTINYIEHGQADGKVSLEVGELTELTEVISYNPIILRLGLESGEAKFTTAELSKFIRCLIENNLDKEIEVAILWGIKQAIIEITSINDALSKLVSSNYNLDLIISTAESAGRDDILSLIYFVTGIRKDDWQINPSTSEIIILPLISRLLTNKEYVHLQEVSKRFLESDSISSSYKVEISKLVSEIDFFTSNNFTHNYTNYSGKYWRKELSNAYAEHALEIVKTKVDWNSDEYANFILSLDLEQVTRNVHIQVKTPVENNFSLVEDNLYNKVFLDRFLYFVNSSSELKNVILSRFKDLFEVKLTSNLEQSEIVFNFLKDAGLEGKELNVLQYKLWKELDKKGDFAKAYNYKIRDPKFFLNLIWLGASAICVFFTIFILFSRYKARKKQTPKESIEKEERAMPLFNDNLKNLSSDQRELYNKLRELGLQHTTDLKLIKNQYRKRVKNLHPDINKNLTPADLEEFARLTQVYDEILKLLKTLGLQ